MNCNCKIQGKNCINSKPTYLGKCSNLPSKVSQFQVLNVDSLHHSSQQLDVSCDMYSETFVDTKMKAAFGVKPLNSEGKPRTERLELIWERSVQLTSALYCILGGSVGRHFTATLLKEALL